MAARIHLNDQFSLCPPLTNSIRERLALSKSRGSSAQKKLPQDKPPKPAIVDLRLEIRSNSLSRRIQQTPRVIRTHQSERVTVTPRTNSPRKPRVLEGNVAMASRLDVPRPRKRKASQVDTPSNQETVLFTLGKVRIRRKPEDLEPPVPRENDSVFPASTRKHTSTSRVLWSLRSDFRTKPLVIVNWEGVLGQWYRPGYSETCEMYVRQGWEQGVKILMQMFAVALVVGVEKAKRSKILAMCAAKGIVFDAVYKKRKADGTSFLLDYSQILSDFALHTTNSVLIISSLGLEPDSLQDRTGVSLIQEVSLSRHRSHCSPAGADPPLCLLVPNLLLGEYCARMDFVAKVVGEWVRFDVDCQRASIDFHSFYSLPAKYTLKRLSVPSDLLPWYQQELQGLDQSRSIEGSSSQSLFVILTGSGNPPGCALVCSENNRVQKNSERRLERKLSTKSLI